MAVPFRELFVLMIVHDLGPRAKVEFLVFLILYTDAHRELINSER
ncbi:MAG: hypothetical protein ACI97A_000683 [Planctomycetota bacterium]|jgi:hypothetical protein